jgi:hypothetical protein
MAFFHFLHYANKHDLPVALCPSVLDGQPETQRSYGICDVARIFLVAMSAPAGMTDRNMVDVVPCAFACRNIPQCYHFSTLKLKARYFVERASNCSL